MPTATNAPTPPPGCRLLRTGERIETGDLYTKNRKTWHPTRSAGATFNADQTWPYARPLKGRAGKASEEARIKGDAKYQLTRIGRIAERLAVNALKGALAIEEKPTARAGLKRALRLLAWLKTDIEQIGDIHLGLETSAKIMRDATRPAPAGMEMCSICGNEAEPNAKELEPGKRACATCVNRLHL